MRYALNWCTCQISEDEQFVTFTGPCIKTGKTYSVTVPAAGVVEYGNGAHIQDAFPNVDKADREFLMTGYSPEGWEQIFGKEEDW